MVECKDAKCFVHGDVKVRGAKTEGTVVSDKGKNTVIIVRDLVKYISKYERYARRKSKIAAHNPACIGAKFGDTVEIGECRKLSKTKAWTVTKVLAKANKDKMKKKRSR
ncbi:MAG: 30S ribosomal protein S17 [Candidatus Micrarchaeota archaeon]